MSDSAFEPLLDAIQRACRNELGERLLAVAVFGSVARGQARLDSDVDLLVVATGWPPGAMARLRAVEPIERAVEAELKALRALGYQAELSWVLWSPEQLAAFSFLHLELATDARILYDPRGLLARRLDEVRRKMASWGTRRVPFKGTYYWVLKPDLKPGEVIEL